MKQHQVPVLPHLNKDSSLFLVAEALDMLPQQEIDNLLWSDKPDGPEAKFSVAYHKDCLFLRYKIKERSVQAKYRQTNDPVYKDSCVELFIAFNGEQEYYNLEFNCLGTCYAGFGQSKDIRKLLPEQKISKIRHWATLKVGNHIPRLVTWQLTLVIPAEVFSEHSLTDFKGSNCKVNFYKCGDELPDPHYLAWNNIESPQPNFHLPEFFGEISFL